MLYQEDSCKNNWQKILNFLLKKIFVIVKIGNKKKNEYKRDISRFFKL